MSELRFKCAIVTSSVLLPCCFGVNSVFIISGWLIRKGRKEGHWFYCQAKQGVTFFITIKSKILKTEHFVSQCEYFHYFTIN